MKDDRYSRQSFLGVNAENILKKTSIAIVGLGGGGSHIAQQLAHIGIGIFYLFDPQYFEKPNMNRTVGAYNKDVGKELKVDIAERMILNINPDAKVYKYTCNWQCDPTAIIETDICIGCLDSFKDRHELEVFCRRFHNPYIDIGMDVYDHGDHYSISGQIITSLPGNLCMKCMGFITDQKLAAEAQKYGDAGPNAQVIWPNGILASIAVGNVMSILTPWSQNPICPFLELDGNLNIVQPSNLFLANKEKNCRHFSNLSDFGDPFIDSN